jgi:hypothetical protein
LIIDLLFPSSGLDIAGGIESRAADISPQRRQASSTLSKAAQAIKNFNQSPPGSSSPSSQATPVVVPDSVVEPSDELEAELVRSLEAIDKAANLNSVQAVRVDAEEEGKRLAAEKEAAMLEAADIKALFLDNRHGDVARHVQLRAENYRAFLKSNPEFVASVSNTKNVRECIGENKDEDQRNFS